MLSGNIKYAALAAADVYVSPSYSEGFSMSVLEGMAAGLPCVITENCNFPEAGMAQAAFVANTDSDSLSDALMFCFKNPIQAVSTGENARNFIFNNYTWDQSAKKISLEYQQILKEERFAS